jgi:hypothetical protein
MADIEALLKQAKPRETVAAVYLDGATAAEIERLDRQLAEASDGTWQASSMADAHPGREIAEKIAAAREKLKASEAEFRFRALPDREWSDLLAAHPPRDAEKEMFNPDTFPAALIAACAVDPAMTSDQVGRLFAVLNQGQRNQLFTAAYEVNTEGTSVPFSVSASAILAALGDGK